MFCARGMDQKLPTIGRESTANVDDLFQAVELVCISDWRELARLLRKGVSPALRVALKTAAENK